MTNYVAQYIPFLKYPFPISLLQFHDPRQKKEKKKDYTHRPSSLWKPHQRDNWIRNSARVPKAFIRDFSSKEPIPATLLSTKIPLILPCKSIKFIEKKTYDLFLTASQWKKSIILRDRGGAGGDSSSIYRSYSSYIHTGAIAGKQCALYIRITRVRERLIFQMSTVAARARAHIYRIGMGGI